MDATASPHTTIFSQTFLPPSMLTHLTTPSLNPPTNLKSQLHPLLQNGRSEGSGKTRKRWVRGNSVGIGRQKRTRDTTGSWNCTAAISSTNTSAEWTRSSNAWNDLSLLARQNNVAAITRRWRKNMVLSLASSKNFAVKTMAPVMPTTS